MSRNLLVLLSLDSILFKILFLIERFDEMSAKFGAREFKQEQIASQTAVSCKHRFVLHSTTLQRKMCLFCQECKEEF